MIRLLNSAFFYYEKAMTTRKFIMRTSLNFVSLVMPPVMALAQSKTDGLAGKSAGEAYKNVQVLKDAPAEQLLSAIEQIEQNTVIDDSKFDKPTAATASGPQAAPK